MNSKVIMKPDLTISQPLAPEDIRVGMFVAVLIEIDERVPMFIFDDAKYRNIQAVKIARWPCMCSDCAGGEPLKVIDVCLPFVLVKRPKSTDCGSGAYRTLDVRQHRLTKLSDAYGRAAHKLLTKKPAAARKRKKS